MVEVPYWWDRTTDSLAATIHKARSDLVPDSTREPISTESPDLITPLNIPPLSHGFPWNESQDIVGWSVKLLLYSLSRWMSEKMDGVRCYWDTKRLTSRRGTVFSCPDWFSSGLPSNITLDGELWLGRGTSHVQLTALIKSAQRDWSQIGYYLFDIPSSSGTYEARMKELETLKPVLSPHIHIVENIQCMGREHSLNYLDLIVESKGEGIILREPESLYVATQTTSILKVKVNSLNFALNLTEV